MRRSSLRHPIAVLRTIIKISQPDFSRLAGIAESTLAKIESLRLPLSKENAIKISAQTGVSMGWLMEGDPLAPPRADEFRFPAEGKEPVEFTRNLFEQCRAQIEFGDSPKIAVRAQLPLIELTAMAASARTLAQQRMFSYKVKKAFEGLAKEFPIRHAELTRREREVFALKELEYVLAKSRGALKRAINQPVNKGALTLLQRLFDYGVALGHIHQSEWQPRRAAIQATGRSNKKHSGRRRQRNKIK
jgi:transcriptional regulator with XRE-family HTH domain